MQRNGQEVIRAIVGALAKFAGILFLAYFFMMFLAGLVRNSSGSKRSTRIACLNNLKQIGIGFRLYANDNSGSFPMQGQSAGYTNQPSQAWRHFAAAGSQLSNPRVLICPADQEGDRSLYSFEGFNGNKFTSYFIGIHAVADASDLILSGDADIYLDNTLMPKNAAFPLSTNYTWGKRHKNTGNLLFADGSATSVANRGLIEPVKKQALTRTNHVGEKVR